jgi:WD40 repeat protein
MGCAGADGKKTTDPHNDDLEVNEILLELYGEAKYRDKTTDELIIEKAYRPTKGERTGANKPFTGAIVEPLKHPQHNSKVPDEDYELEYIYGYRAYDSRQNLYFTANNKVTYCAASIGITLDPQTNTQTFFAGGRSTKDSTKRYHDNDVVCLSVSPDKKLVATGQVGLRPILNIWEADTGKFRCKYEMAQRDTCGIMCCAWSIDGKYIAFADHSKNYAVYIIESATGKLVQSEGNKGSQVIDIGWSKKPGDYTFAVCGVRNIGFWTVGGNLKRGVGHDAQSFAALAFDDNGVCYVGSFKGKIYVFPDTSTSQNIDAHRGSVFAMCWSDKKLYTGGIDKNILVFDKGLNQINRITMDSGIRSLDINNDNILVGLRNGSINLISQGKTDCLMKSHHEGELWGLDITEEGTVVTTGDDNKVMLWSVKERKNKDVGVINAKEGSKIKYGASSLTSMPDNQCARAVAVNLKTGEVAIGVNDGEVQVRNLKNVGVVKKSMKAGDRWIEAMVYSPNGDYLAVGTHDSTVVVYSTDTYEQRGLLKGNSAAILSLDWSMDGKYIRTVSLSYEYLFYRVDDMKQDTNGATNTKELDWATQNCKIGWPVQGILEGSADYTQVNGVTMSSDKKLIASGNDSGAVSIFRNPCLIGSQSKKLQGHSEHVVRVKFGLNDQYLFSVGGQDKTLMQWKKC